MTNVTTPSPPIPATEDPFELIPSPWGVIERWRASTLSTGTMGALAQVCEIVRADAAEAVARADAMEARKALVQRLCDQVAEMQERINTLAEPLEARHRADQEEQERERLAAFEQEPIELPPGTSEVPDEELEVLRHPDDTHVPGGELHDVPPKEERLPEPTEEDQELPEPPELTSDQAEFEDPEDLETLTDARRRRTPSRHRQAPTFRSPVAVEEH
jgi:hypothetical protein